MMAKVRAGGTRRSPVLVQVGAQHLIGVLELWIDGLAAPCTVRLGGMEKMLQCNDPTARSGKAVTATKGALCRSSALAKLGRPPLEYRIPTRG